MMILIILATTSIVINLIGELRMLFLDSHFFQTLYRSGITYLQKQLTLHP